MSNKGADHPATVSEPSCELRPVNDRAHTRTATTVLPLIAGAHSTGDAIKTSDVGSRMRDTGVPESSVPGTTDRHEEKRIDSVIQCSQTLTTCEDPAWKRIETRPHRREGCPRGRGASASHRTVQA